MASWLMERENIMDNKFYDMTIAGLKRRLPICSVSENLDIAGFILFGDVEITIAAAKELIKKVGEFDIIATPEAKSIPLAYELSRQTGKPYIVARKGTKVYMKDPICVNVQSITTKSEQKLYLGKDEVELLKGKRVLIVDDVISTGESLRSMQLLVKEAGGKISCSCAILAEGDAAERDEIVFLEKLPLFFK